MATKSLSVARPPTTDKKFIKNNTALSSGRTSQILKIVETDKVEFNPTVNITSNRAILNSDTINTEFPDKRKPNENSNG
jgi:hypothetical protein